MNGNSGRGEVAAPAGERAGPACISATAVSSRSTIGVGGVGVPVEDGPAVGQLHPLGIKRPHLQPPGRMAGSIARTSDHITEAFPDPVAPAISTCVDISLNRQGSRPPTARPAAR